MLVLGFNEEEIAKIMDTSIDDVMDLIEMLKTQKKITKKRIKEARDDKEEHAESRRRNIQGIISFEANLDIGKIKEHTEYVKAMFHLGKIEAKDIRLLREAIQMDTELMIPENISLIATYYIKRKEPMQAITFFDECMECFSDDDERKETLIKAKEVLHATMVRAREYASKKNEKDAKAEGNTTIWSKPQEAGASSIEESECFEL